MLTRSIVATACLLTVIGATGCIFPSRNAAPCDSPAGDAKRSGVRRATAPTLALAAHRLAGLVVWVGGQALDPPASSEAHVQVVDAYDTLAFATTIQGVGSRLIHRPGVVTVRVRRLGYIRSSDTLTLREGFADTIGFGLWQERLCLGRVTVD